MGWHSIRQRFANQRITDLLHIFLQLGFVRILDWIVDQADLLEYPEAADSPGSGHDPYVIRIQAHHLALRHIEAYQSPLRAAA
jgi:hypothetical protein